LISIAPLGLKKNFRLRDKLKLVISVKRKFNGGRIEAGVVVVSSWRVSSRIHAKQFVKVGIQLVFTRFTTLVDGNGFLVDFVFQFRQANSTLSEVKIGSMVLGVLISWKPFFVKVKSQIS